MSTDYNQAGQAKINWIDDDAALAAAVAQWPDHIALDTEFIRTNTYFPMPGLYQIAAGDEVFLIDPLQVRNWQPFIDYLRDVDTTKIMHACLEDLELLHHHLGISPRNVFDTQYANAFLSEDFSLSYAGLVERRLGVALQKHETRSNWLQRPLSDDQIRYAVEDVTYLLSLYEDMNRALGEKERLSWFSADMEQRVDYAPSDPVQYYRNVKKAWQLEGPALGALQALCAWREETARLENVPRNRVIWDEHLYSFAASGELTARDIGSSLPRGVARRYSDDLLERHHLGRTTMSPASLPRPLSTAQGVTLKSLRNVARAKTTSLGVAAELLARKKDLELCIRHHATNAQLSPHYLNWRGELVGESFLSILNGDAG